MPRSGWVRRTCRGQCRSRGSPKVGLDERGELHLTGTAAPHGWRKICMWRQGRRSAVDSGDGTEELVGQRWVERVYGETGTTGPKRGGRFSLSR